MWRRDWIEAQRVRSAPALRQIVVAVDPPVTATAASDACGIVVAGKGEGPAFQDRSVQGREPQVWARAAIAARRDFDADRIVAEVNQGGDLVVGVLRQIEPGVFVRKVRATRGKWVRAEPVAALYAEGRVRPCRELAELEDEMFDFGTDGQSARPQSRPPRRPGLGADRADEPGRRSHHAGALRHIDPAQCCHHLKEFHAAHEPLAGWSVVPMHTPR